MTGPIGSSVELAKYLCSADVCVNPGYLGLSVVDCMFAGVPVIAPRPGCGGPYHSPEWRYVEESGGGYLVPDGTASALAQAAYDYLHLPESEMNDIRSKCADYAERHLGLGPMVEGLQKTVKEVTQARR